MPKRHAVFLINLLQDVNILRPLVFMASRDMGMKTEFLVTAKFIHRDAYGIWQQELNEISQTTITPILIYEDVTEALQFIQGKAGVIVSASETDLAAHTPTHDVMRLAPSSFLKITLQHGFECPGFLHNRAHDIAHGRDITFAADVICGWCESSRLTSITPTQKSKLYVTGPPTILQMQRMPGTKPGGGTGLICENLHSVRLNATGNFKVEFMEIFKRFSVLQAARGNDMVLRPHPGGQYILKNKISLPANVIVNNNPIYKVDLGKFAYGISAPSSVVLDMVLARIPVAIWSDETGEMDTGNYAGLAEIRTLDDWLDFSNTALTEPEKYIKRQERFLKDQRMPTDPADIYGRFYRLFHAQERISVPAVRSNRNVERILLIANSMIQTVQISFVKPLSPLTISGEVSLDFLTEQQILDRTRNDPDDRVIMAWLDDQYVTCAPTVLIFCRYSGPYVEHLINLARRDGIPVIFHIDDDLLNLPMNLGDSKYKFHNQPERLATIQYLLNHSDLVYCSTPQLFDRIRSYGITTPMTAGKIYCSGEILASPVMRKAKKIGYMGTSGHIMDLATVVPALVRFLRRNPDIEFEVFGSIPVPDALKEFSSRIISIPQVNNYEMFLKKFTTLKWDVGICPLEDTLFNTVKANTKWVEYTCVGIAVVATAGMAYDDCCADGCGKLASSTDEWVDALENLVHNDEARYKQLIAAQQRVREEYYAERLCRQVLDIIQETKLLYEKKRSQRANTNNIIIQTAT